MVNDAQLSMDPGPQDPARSLVLQSGLWNESLHDEIWVYNQGWWQKDHQLWVDIQSADWKDVILKDGMSATLVNLIQYSACCRVQKGAAQGCLWVL